MSFTIQCWNYAKKHNSTARPDSAQPQYTFNINLKQRTSLNTPIFILEINGVPNFTYVKWVDINTYYYVTDIVSMNNNIWEIHCDVDDLATARPYIINSDAFVKYSTKNFNPYLKDDRIIPTAEIETIASNNSQRGLFNEHPEYTSSYTLLLTAMSSYTIEEAVYERDYGGLFHYIINETSLEYLITKLMKDSKNPITGIKEAFGDSKNSIIKLQIIPWELSRLQQMRIAPAETTGIYLGTYETNQSGYEITSASTFVSDDFIDLPTRNDNFTRVEPFCEAILHLPFVGNIDLSLSELEDVNRIYFRMICNIASGKLTYIVWKGNAQINNSNVKIIGTWDCNINVEIPIGMVLSSNPMGIATGLLTSIASGVSGGAIGISGIASSVSSMLSQFKKQCSVIGALGGNVPVYDNLKVAIYLFKKGLSEEPENMALLYGRPCCKVINLAELQGGYVQTSQFSLLAPFDDFIINSVNAKMDSGIYLQ